MLTHAVHEGQGVVLFDQDNVIIAGSDDDIRAAKKLYQLGARLLWFRRDNKTYVTRSPAAMQQADALLAQEHAQARSANEAIDKLVAKQDQLVAQRDELVSQRDKLAGEESRLVGLQSSTTQNQQALDHIHAQQAALQKQLGVLDTQTEHIRQQQANLDARHSASSDEYDRLAIGLVKLADEALASGTAQEVSK